VLVKPNSHLLKENFVVMTLEEALGYLICDGTLKK
jgi:hypothetical protein